MNAGRLEIELLANMARLQSDMADAKRSVGGAMAGIESSVATAKNALVGLGVVGAVVTFAGTIKGAIDAADQINKLSQRTGLAAEQLSQLQFAAKLSDVSTESLTTGLKKLNVSIAEGLAGDKDKIANFRALGITLTDASGKAKTADQVLLDMADSLSTAKNGADKTAVSVALLGKAGDEMIPLLNGGSQAINEMMGNADKLGLTISTSFAQQAEQFNDSLAIVSASTQKLSIALAGDFVAGLGAAMKAMVDATIEGGKLQGMLAGLQTLLTGNDRHKANVAMVDATEKLMAAQNALDSARARGDDATVARLTNRVAMLREEYGLNQRMALQLDAQIAKEAAAKPQQTREIKAPSRLPTGLSDAERAAEKERNDRIAWGRKLVMEQVDALRKRNEELEKEQKLLEELAAKQYLDYVTAIDKAVMASVEALGAGMREAEQYGLLKSQITELTVAKLEAARVSAITPEELAAIDAQIANYRRLVDVQRGMEAAEASRQAAQDAAREWQKATDQIQQALTDALMNGGKNAADYITGLFRSMVLRPIISAAINPLAGAVTSALGIGGPGGAGSTLSGIGALSGAFGGGLNAGFSSLFNEAGLGGAFSAGSGALSAGNIAGGLGTFAGALAPFLAGAGLLASLQGGETRGGGQYKGTNLLAAPSGGQIDAANITGAIGTTTGAINALLGRLGSSTRLSEFFSGLETSDNGKGFAYAGGALSTGRVFGQGQNGLGYLNRRGNFDAAGAVTAFGEELSQAALQALQADLDNLPDYVRKYLEGIDVDAMGKDAADKLLASIDAVATQRATLEQQLYELTTSDAQKLLDVRTREREAIDASNSTLLDRVYALQDEKTAAAEAAAEAAAAAQEKARIEEQVAQQRNNLQTQLWQLEGNTAALRGAELAALDPSNRALQQHIWALQDQAAAAETARAAQDRYNQSLSEANQFLAGVGATIGGYLARLNTTDAGLLSPQSQLVNARELYQQQLAMARSGDRGALSNITQYADSFLNASKAYSGSGGATGSILDALRGDLVALPSQVRPEQLIVDAVNQTTTAVGTLQASLLQSLQANFGQLDTSLNGTLDLSEFTKGLSKFASEDTLKALFTSLDANGDGQLTRLESLGQTADKQLAAADLQNRQLEAIGFQQRQLDSIWQRLGGANDYLSQILQQQYYDGQRQDFQSVQFDTLWRRLGDLANAGGGGGGADTINIRVVTPSGSELTNTVITNLRERSRWGEIVVYASGVGA